MRRGLVKARASVHSKLAAGFMPGRSRTCWKVPEKKGCSWRHAREVYRPQPYNMPCSK
jgi:hypothetical protein